MSLLDDIDWALPGLLAGSFRGITFHMPDTSTSVGRRVMQSLYPGIDTADYDDFGVSPDTIEISGLIIGDDYQAQAAALAAAFRTPGPAMLIHPWLGPMQVILAEDPARISFSATELRVVRFTATFKEYTPGAGDVLGSLAGLVSAIDGIVAAASAIIGVVGTIISATQTKSVQRSTRVVTSAIGSLTPPSGSVNAVSQLKTAIAASSPSTPAEFDTLIISAAAIINAVNSTPAVSPAAEAATIVAPTPESLTAIGLAMVNAMTTAAASAPSDADTALLLSTAAHFAGQTAAQSVYADYSSRQDAQTFRGQATDALDTLADALEAIRSPMFLTTASTLRRATRGVQSALIVDINETIGRLPSVLTFNLDRPTDAWGLAQYVYGDTPSQIEAAYADIVARNKPRHPARLEGSVEVLGS